MNFEIGKLYRLKVRKTFFCLLTRDLITIKSQSIILYVDDIQFYKDKPRAFLFEGKVYLDSWNWTKRGEPWEFEEVIVTE